MKRASLYFTVIVYGLLLCSSLHGQSPADSLELPKRRYSLFNPTPKHLMREMHTDRPDVTETPFTVDAGHLQFEFDFFNIYRHPLTLKRRETDFLLLNGIAKIGLTDRLDFEVIFSASQWHFPDTRSTKLPSITDTIQARRGFGDIGLRTKINLIGNAHERYGLALMPSLLIPLPNPASEATYMHGLTLIWATTLLGKFELGGQVEYFRLYDVQKNFQHPEYWATIELGFDLSHRLSAFTEYVSIMGEQKQYFHTVNGGLIYALSPNFRLDMATNIGLNQRSPSAVFVGFSCRI
jgi:hypothetical protein